MDMNINGILVVLYRHQNTCHAEQIPLMHVKYYNITIYRRKNYSKLICIYDMHFLNTLLAQFHMLMNP
jgi:hypothetical protein